MTSPDLGSPTGDAGPSHLEGRGVTEPRPFDLIGPLPQGTTVLEASAGTGKTYTIAGLAVRWVAETPLRLPQLLVVTFTRAATAELRDRVRRRLVEAADHLEAAIDGVARRDLHDPLLRHLADGPREELSRRHGRLARAISDVDVATISTIHGFCQHVLDGLGIASDLDREAELVEDVTELIEEVVDDLLVETYLEPEDRPRISRDDLVAIGRAVVANPTTGLTPTSPQDPSAGLRVHLAQRLRGEVVRRARRRRQLSYDDLLTQLDATLRDPDRGGAAREALRQRYHVALIDEFQDTDPVQWSIVSRAFRDDRDARDGRGPRGPGDVARALVLIGDPKQAIYAFRGADVYAYLDAVAHGDDQLTLGTNWRSDAGLLRAFETLFHGATFGDVDIPFRPVDPAPHHRAPRLLDAPNPTPLRLRVVTNDGSLQGKRSTSAGDVRTMIAGDVAADVVRLLGSPARKIDRDLDDNEVDGGPVVPRDIAVLVRSNNEARLIQDALHAVGVPSVVGGAESVFATTAAGDWRRLLDALERPSSTTRVRALALTSWVGWTGTEIAHKSERDWEQLHDDVHRWAAVLRERGVASMHRTVLLQREVRPRLLTVAGGERLLADLEHIGELLHAAATAEHLGATGLASWLHDRIADAGSDQQDDRLRRLETDDEAVQILTIHRSKGLEFPVVYCPFLWSSNTVVRGVPVFHDATGRRLIDVGGTSHDAFDDSKVQAEQELRGEELRLAYVAMTRARHQVVAWYACAGWSEWSGLGRLLLCRDERGQVRTDQPAPDADDEQLTATLEALADRSDGTLSIETVPSEPSTTPWQPEVPPPAELDRARFRRPIDESWRRTSYSALTRIDDPLPRVGSEPDEAVKDDEAIAADVVSTDTDGAAANQAWRHVTLPLADMPGGTEVGTFVHRVFEEVDFTAHDLAAEVHAGVDAGLRRRRLDLDVDAVVAGLEAAMRTPLGPAVGDLALTDVARPHRRDEVPFELPLDHAVDGRAATVADMAGLLREHLGPDDPLRHYPDHLEPTLLRRDLRGFLGGSIDLVFRRTGDNDQPVFHVADYKTNRLGTWGEPLSAWDYRPDALADAMMHGHYPLQALLYTVAVHRLLRWRQPDYDPDIHLGAVLYLFVRGMVGPDTPLVHGQPCGVFAWEPPTSLVVAASDLLHGVRPNVERAGAP